MSNLVFEILIEEEFSVENWSDEMRFVDDRFVLSNTVIDPYTLCQLFDYFDVYLTFQWGDVATVALEEYDFFEFFRWVNEFARPFNSASSIWTDGLFWTKDKYYYAMGPEVYEMEVYNGEFISGRLFERAEWIYDNRNSWVELCIERESGKEYAHSKWAKKQKDQRTTKKKCEQKILDATYVDDWRKRARIKKLLQQKLRSVGNNCNFEKESGIDPRVIFESLEKVGGLFMLNYLDKPIHKAIAAASLLMRGSVTCVVYDILRSLCTESKSLEGTLSDFVSWIKLLVVDIDKFKNNRFAKPFVRLFSKFVTTFLCPDLRETVGQIFEKDSLISNILDHFSSEFHPFESLVHLSTYFTNAVDVFIKTGELTGFIETQSLDDILISEVREMRDAFNLFKTGDVEFVKEYKIYEFIARLKKLKETLSVMRKSRKALDLKEIDNWIREVDHMDREVTIHNIHHSTKMQGYYLSISSGSGISKGHLMNLIANTLAAANNIPHTPEYHYTLNQANKFQSGWSNATTIVKVDDAAAMMSTVEGVLCLADWLLRGSNNVPHELLGADITEKGTLFNRALIEVWTSNSFNMFFDEEARFPSALHRRFQTKIVAKVKPEYTKTIVTNGDKVSSQIDYNKMPKEMRESIAPDAWMFTVYTCQIFDSPIKVKVKSGAVEKEKDNDYIFVPAKRQGEDMVDVSLAHLIEFLIEDSQSHFAQQQDVLAMSDKLSDPNSYCEHGRPKGLACHLCEEKKPIKPKRTAESLRNRIVSNAEYRANADKVLGPDRFDYFTMKDYDFYHYYESGYDYAFKKPIKTYNKDQLYRAFYTHGDVVYTVTREYNVDAVREMPFADLLLPECVAMVKESGTKSKYPRVRYMQTVLDWVQFREIDTSVAWDEARDVLDFFTKIRLSLRDTLQTWFDSCILDVMMMVVDKLMEYVEEAMRDPWKHVPKFVEGTAVGAYIHSRRPALLLPAIADWTEYNAAVFQQWTENPYAVSAVKPEYRWSKKVYETFMATPTRSQRAAIEDKKSLTFTQFMFGCGMMVSEEEKKRKESDPCLLRDTFLPAIAGCAAVTSFIPRFCDNFASMYTEAQVGYMVSVDEIESLDKEETKNWYAAKAEIMKQEVKVDGTIKFTELENLVNKNTLYVNDMENGQVACGLSPRNQFLLLPGHFVDACINHVVEVTKVPYSNSPGNAMFKFSLQEKLITRLPGDVALVHVEQHMDHMRTKDLLRWFPTTPPVDADVGRLLYKSMKGEVQHRDVTAITYSHLLNNENVLFTLPKNPFKGHIYSANTFKGLCGAPLVDHTHKKSCILGIHVGGRKADGKGISCFISKYDLEKAIARWDTNCIVQESGCTLESYGIELFEPEIYHKNPVFDTTDRNDFVEVLGSTKKRSTRKSQVVYTPIYEAVRSEFNLRIDWKAPDFKFNGDKRHGARSLYRTLSTKNVLRHPKFLQVAVEDYRSRVISALMANPDFWRKELKILEDHEIVNGTGKKYCTGMNFASKFDAHLPGPKSEHADLIDGQWYFKDYVWKEFRKREAKMREGKITYELLVNALKNEATKTTAVAVGKVRNFFMCGTPLQMMMRKYLQTTCRFYCLTTGYSECTVGINPHSTAWGKLFDEVKVFKKFIALDFKNFDLTSLSEVISEALDLVFLPRRTLFELTTEELNVQKCIKHAIMHAICDINGDVMVLKAIIPSGINLTSILGCIVNSLNFRMAYYFLNISTKPFHEVVVLRTYGDDSFGSTNDVRFSVRNILYAYSEMGIQATDMHKNKVSTVKFYDILEIEFLKRKGRWDPDFGAFVAPLVEGSRFKMLCCHVPTKHMSLEAVTGQCVDNFLLESAFHGRKIYNKEQKLLACIMESHNLTRFCQTLNYSFDDRVKEWKSKYKDGVLVTGKEATDSTFLARLASLLIWNNKNWAEWAQKPGSEGTPTYKKENTCSLVSKAEDVETRPLGVTNQDLSVQNKGELEGLECIGFIQESGVQKEEILSFVEMNEEETLRIGGTVPEVRASGGDCSLQQFLARPVKIADYAWGASTTFSAEIDPWNELWNNKRIANRISNYKLFRGTCHVKVIVNGNGFYYGKLMLAYLPFEQVDQRSHFSPLNPLNRIPMSQCPHVFLDATTSKSCTMELPFFYPADYVSLQDSDINRSLGTIGVYEIAGLQHANQNIVSTLNNLTVSVYAWFEDVELVGPTHLNIQGIVAQSGTEDEEVSKPISQACTAVASAAKHLAPIPYIGPYALAIEQGAKMTATVASALGYSNPLDCVEPNRYQPRMLGNTCVANTTDSAMKLSLDVKQDTTIDPQSVGLSGKDEMSIQHIASRESFINTFTWSTAQTVNTMLYNYRVTPMMTTATGLGIDNYISAICGATIPFTYWNGSITYKFQVICSANHKGRLAVVYDPNYTSNGLTLESNVAYMEIVDISENREFEVTLHNHQPQQWLRVDEAWYGNVPGFHSPDRYNTFLAGTNGTLSLYVLNELTSPASDPTIGNTITIAAYIKAGDDYQVANPSGRLAAYQAFIPESGVSEVVDSNINIDHKMEMKQRQMRVYQGEVIESFRMLLKRYQNYTRVSRIGLTETSYNAWYLDHQGFPAMPGVVNNIPYTGSNQVAFTYLQYLMGAFSGWKGGIRWKTILDLPNTSFMMARRDTDAVNSYANAIDTSPSGTAKAQEFALIGNQATSFGGVWTNTAVNPTLEIELPFYSQYKFIAGKPFNITQAFLGAYTQQLRILTQKCDDNSENDHSHSLLVSAGEDFTCYFFTGFPPIKCYLVAPS